jgi:uncharacterized protein YndB with AHSA1/START domain
MNRRQRQRRARLIRLAVVGPIALVAGSLGVGLLLPNHHRERMVRTYHSSPEAVFEVLTDLDAMPNWRRDLDAVERLPGTPGTVRWREWDRRRRTVALERTEASPPSRFVVAVAMGRASRIRWTYELRPVDRGTEVSITEDRLIGNPAGRTFVKIFGASRARVEGWADDLEARLNSRRQRLANIGATP